MAVETQVSNDKQPQDFRDVKVLPPLIKGKDLKVVTARALLFSPLLIKCCQALCIPTWVHILPEASNQSLSVAAKLVELEQI